MRLKYLILSIAILICFPFFSEGQVKLPSIFGDHMVLQQQSKVAIWGQASERSTVTISTSWGKQVYKTKAGDDGAWKTFITTPAAGGPHEITISDGKALTLRDVMTGEVWLCSGQSNMEMPMKGFKGQPVAGSNDAILRSANKHIRMVTVPRASSHEPLHDFKGNWAHASPESVAEFSATAYYFGKLLNDILDVPVGLIHVSYSGSNAEAWMNEAWLRELGVTNIPVKGDPVKDPNRTPTLLYNGMLSPVIGFGIKGCIWYQGESNYTDPDLYEKLLEKMVKGWRAQWGLGDFPFYYTQIAPYDYTLLPQSDRKEKHNSAYLRDAQRKLMTRIPNSGMAVLMDAGETDNIHPANKRVAGERLAYWALGKTYGIRGFSYTSPTYDTLEIKGNTVIVSFDDAPNGITSFGKQLTTFEIAGKDKKFYPAKAVAGRKSVTLSSPDVPEPVAVRYAFRDFVTGELFGTDALPVSSFRTDEWEE